MYAARNREPCVFVDVKSQMGSQKPYPINIACQSQAPALPGSFFLVGIVLPKFAKSALLIREMLLGSRVA